MGKDADKESKIRIIGTISCFTLACLFIGAYFIPGFSGIVRDVLLAFGILSAVGMTGFIAKSLCGNSTYKKEPLINHQILPAIDISIYETSYTSLVPSKTTELHRSSSTEYINL